MWLATTVLTLIGRGPLESLLLGHSGLWLLGSLLLGRSDLQLLESLLLARSHHMLPLPVGCGTWSCSDRLVELWDIQGLKQGLLSLSGARSALQTKTTKNISNKVVN
jgi:hypothetical protein